MWSGPNIVVFNNVTINPPYKKENVSGNPDSREFLYIQKIVSLLLINQLIKYSFKVWWVCDQNNEFYVCIPYLPYG